MKTAIVYASVHHGNTKKLVDAIAGTDEITLIDATKQKSADLSGYDRIGFASGIYFLKFHRTVLRFAEENLPEGKDIFILYTEGTTKFENKTKSIQDIAKAKSAHILGEYGCLGYDTYGPFKLVGGIAKGHPTEEELAKAVDFYKSL